MNKQIVLLFSCFLFLLFQNCSGGFLSQNNEQDIQGNIQDFQVASLGVPPLAATDLRTVLSSGEYVEGQTGSWWCKNHFQNLGDWSCVEVGNGGTCNQGVPVATAVTCMKRDTREVTSSARYNRHRTGQWWCDKHFGRIVGGSWQCVDVNGLARCHLGAPSKSTVRCQRYDQFDELREIFAGEGRGQFLTSDTSCSRSDLDEDEQEFCKYTNYMQYRSEDVTYLTNSYVRVGVHKAYGGTIFELYGTDLKNRIQEHGGSAMQMSLWGYPQEPLDMEGVKVCGKWNVNSPINPIQAQSKDCTWERSFSTVDNWFQSPAGITIEKSNPYNFTKGSAVEGMNWSQRVSLPALVPYIKVDYSIQYDGISLGIHNQEVPAIFSDDSISHHFYFRNEDGFVQSITKDKILSILLPDRNTNLHPLPKYTPEAMEARKGKDYQATESWLTACNETESECITVAVHDPMITAIAADGNYLTPLARFAMPTGFAKTWKVYVFPYRHNQVVRGKSIRQWANELK